jgi:hypothetical protein
VCPERPGAITTTTTTTTATLAIMATTPPAVTAALVATTTIIRRCVGAVVVFAPITFELARIVVASVTASIIPLIPASFAAVAAATTFARAPTMG